ncbi:hypothetical protein BOTBODRAFT_55659 [Botryobasidium botryosum FD-172 SS1]|uniref:Uncharacterized protein n=1 Tax=Botryobasidium botryosum (strain FD-172 SS1) TaxID=930990 RepID=A0A067MEN3_BOTB1|nr:hypothetical protein BOTBODRAFT_55659 [Botryobasidium botryosum FD-172 SS1]
MVPAALPTAPSPSSTPIDAPQTSEDVIMAHADQHSIVDGNADAGPGSTNHGEQHPNPSASNLERPSTPDIRVHGEGMNDGMSDGTNDITAEPGRHPTISTSAPSTDSELTPPPSQ